MQIALGKGKDAASQPATRSRNDLPSERMRRVAIRGMRTYGLFGRANLRKKSIAALGDNLVVYINCLLLGLIC